MVKVFTHREINTRYTTGQLHASCNCLTNIVVFLYFLLEYNDKTELRSAKMSNIPATTKMIIATLPITLDNIR